MQHQSGLFNPHHMVPPLLSSQSNPIHYQPPQAGKRPRLSEGEGNDDEHRLEMHLQILRRYVEGTQSPELLLSAYSDSSTQRRASAQFFALPPPIHQQDQYHHHHLPLLPSGLPSAVGQVGIPKPATCPRGRKLKFTPKEDELLVELKEDKNLTWNQICDYFPGRTSGTLQVHYCTKLKVKDTVWTDNRVRTGLSALWPTYNEDQYY
jgi:hypothetical protein